MFRGKLLLLLLFIVLSEVAIAKDFGKQGTTFEIKEEGFLSMIYRKLQDVDIEQEQKKMQELARKKIEEPDPVWGIVKAKEDRIFTYDTTYILPDNVYLPDGKLLYLAGTMVNPLDHISLEKKLVFIDGLDKAQVTWFKKQIEDKNVKEHDKLILVSGRPFDMEEDLGRQVYFDQAGALTGKFGIKAVPAVVEQEGKMLKITEVFLGDDKAK